ncbi:hypothetical protein [Streptomyces triculaminicus]|uniref:hypothetical protein n=1 Tax=Streptomyces TaxID=1883 RepID=UPI00340D885B
MNHIAATPAATPPGADRDEVYAFTVTMAACLALALAGRASPAALTDYAAALTGLYTAWHNRPRT